MGPELWHYFSSSECEQRDPEVLGCLVSRLQIGMATVVPYDLVSGPSRPTAGPSATAWSHK